MMFTMFSDLTSYAPFLTNFWGYFLAVAVAYFVGKFFTSPEKQTTGEKLIDFMDLDNKDDEDLGLDTKRPADHEHEVEQIPYSLPRYGSSEMIRRSREFYEVMNGRRTTRFFSDDPVPFEVIQNVIRTAGTSPSGAHTEPWTYVVISNKKVKSQVRDIVEAEEKISYEKRMGKKWVEDLRKLRTSFVKPYLEKAPYLIVIFRQMYGIGKNGERLVHYYNEISTTISTGLLLAALQNVGLATVTSTPLNTGHAMRSLLNRPANEKFIMLLPVGYTAKVCTVPDLKRKPLEGIMVTMN